MRPLVHPARSRSRFPSCRYLKSIMAMGCGSLYRAALGQARANWHEDEGSGWEHRSRWMEDKRGAAMMSSFEIRLGRMPTSEGATELRRPC